MDLMDGPKGEFYPIQMCLWLNKNNKEVVFDDKDWNCWLNYYWTIQENARLELHKDDAWCFKQIMDAAPIKTAVVRPLTSHLTNCSIKTAETCWELLGKKGRAHKRSSSMDSDTWTHQSQPTN